MVRVIVTESVLPEWGTCWWAGVVSAWEQDEKRGVREMLARQIW